MNTISGWLVVLLCALSCQQNSVQTELRVGLSQNTAPQKQGNTLHFETKLFRVAGAG